MRCNLCPRASELIHGENTKARWETEQCSILLDEEEKQGWIGGVELKEKICLMCQGKVTIMKKWLLLFICARNVGF